MAVAGSVSQWLVEARGGDESAFTRLHERYWPRLVELARARLRGIALPSADDEDVAQVAVIAFFRSLRAGQLPQLETRHQLIALLTHIVACKAASEVEYQLAKKRSPDRVVHDAWLEQLADVSADSPEQQAMLRDCYDYYLQSVPAKLREIAALHLAGLTYREIAARLECAERTVERKMILLKTHWQSLANTQFLSVS